MPIRIASPQELLKIDKAHFRKVAESVLANEDINTFEISLAFVDDATSQRVNNQFLKHDYPTDVISFPYSAGKSLQGELVLGVEVALREAAERGHDPQTELSLYVIHGLLHLVGYDDKDPHDKLMMRDRESEHLELLGLPDISSGSEE